LIQHAWVPTLFYMEVLICDELPMHRRQLTNTRIPGLAAVTGAFQDCKTSANIDGSKGNNEYKECQKR